MSTYIGVGTDRGQPPDTPSRSAVGHAVAVSRRGQPPNQ
jgi:hypothetical protein